MQIEISHTMNFIDFGGVSAVFGPTNEDLIFFLLQKDNVLVAACDTSRSGAVEQLVQVRNLKELTEREGGIVKLYERATEKMQPILQRTRSPMAKRRGTTFRSLP